MTFEEAKYKKQTIGNFTEESGITMEVTIGPADYNECDLFFYHCYHMPEEERDIQVKKFSSDNRYSLYGFWMVPGKKFHFIALTLPNQ